MRTIVFWGLYWGSPILGNYHFVEHIEVLDFDVTLRVHVLDNWVLRILLLGVVRVWEMLP